MFIVLGTEGPITLITLEYNYLVAKNIFIIASSLEKSAKLNVSGFIVLINRNVLYTNESGNLINKQNQINKTPAVLWTVIHTITH